MAPPAEGDYFFEVDLVQTDVARFSEHGSIPWTSRVSVGGRK
jgi:hypothetical protein